MIKQLCFATAILLPAAPALCQPVELPNPMPATQAPADEYTEAQLMALVAPVALYPDPLLTDVLAASTYPAQIVEAQRLLVAPENAGLNTAALVERADQHDWDPSVRALIAFPPVLNDMNTRLEWFEHLGRAFEANPGGVLAAVQKLRAQAEQSGALQNGPDASVVNEGGNILIEPPQQDQVYVPSYDSACVFATGPCGGVSALAWGDPVILPYGYAQWGGVDWERRSLRFGHGGWRSHPEARVAGEGREFGDVWHHGARSIREAQPPAAIYGFAPPAAGQFSQVPVTRHFAPQPAGLAHLNVAHFAPRPAPVPPPPALPTGPVIPILPRVGR